MKDLSKIKGIISGLMTLEQVEEIKNYCEAILSEYEGL